MLLIEQSMCCVFYRLTIEGNKYLTNKQNVLECKNKTRKKTYQPTKQKTDRQKPPKHTAEEYGHENKKSPRKKGTPRNNAPRDHHLHALNDHPTNKCGFEMEIHTVI